MTQPYPAALVIASLESVLHDNNVLYRLVRPLADGSGVESTDRLVNVVPHRRTYCFERKEQFDTFSNEILKRPLVIQPVLHFGRGLGPFCGACYNDEPWVVMINQTHPKILGRLQMGLELARSAVSKGLSVEIKFRFGKLIERIYREHLEQKESGEAESKSGLKRTLAKTLLQFRYVEWDHGDLTLRSHGLAAKLKTSTRLMLEMDNVEKVWDFEDIGMHDMVWSQWQHDLVFPGPNLAPVSEDEIRAVLPGWTINAVTPLEAIGEVAPVTYSYAQAGRLYASFRKTRKFHNDNSYENRHLGADSNYDRYNRERDFEAQPMQWNPEGAEAMPENWVARGTDALPKMHQIDTDEEYYEDYPNDRFRNDCHSISHKHHDKTRHEPAKFKYSLEGAQSQYQSNATGLPHADKYGHIMPQVHIHQPGKQHECLYNLKKQDSDRSSRSTNADSGYCPGTDNTDQKSRGGSYDLNEDLSDSKLFSPDSLMRHDYQPWSSSNRHSPSLHDQYALTKNLSNGGWVEGGTENPAFHCSIDEGLNSDKILQSHRQLVNKVLAEEHSNSSFTKAHNNYSVELSTSPKQLPTTNESVSSFNRIAESFI